MDIQAILKGEFANYSEIADKPFDLVDIDSFRLVEVRSAIEAAAGVQIDDATWTRFSTLAEIARWGGRRAESGAARGHAEERKYLIGMPQMANAGLSESWLFKEVGDIHWSLLSRGIRMKPSSMIDGAGNRLYATFTRVHIKCAPLATFREDASLNLVGNLSRYGGGIYLGEFEGRTGDGQHIQSRTMSSFSRRSAENSNHQLAKGQPDVPPDCPIRVLTEKPAFSAAYSEARKTVQSGMTPKAEIEYALNPYHDINGVGLLYFAAFPIIFDTCMHRLYGNRYAASSTVERDVCYFSNANLSDRVIFKVLEHTETGTQFNSLALLLNEATAAPMALIRTHKQ